MKTAHDGDTGTEGMPVSTQGPPSLEDLIKLDDVTVVYGKTVVAVDRVSLAVREGHTLGIVGETGSGKSTLANVVMGIIEPTEGRVLVSGRDLAEVRGRDRLTLQRLRQVVMQDPFSSRFNGRLKIRDIVAEPPRLGRWAVSSSARKKINERVFELLELVGLPKSRATYYPHQFSGGQRQRISIARALAPDPKIIVLDEPTSALDVSVRAQILTLLKSIQQRLGVTFLVISHDFVTVSYLASTVAVMHRGPRLLSRSVRPRRYSSHRVIPTRSAWSPASPPKRATFSIRRPRRPKPRANYRQPPAGMRYAVISVRCWATRRGVSRKIRP